MKHAHKIQAKELLHLKDVVRSFKSIVLFMKELMEIGQALITRRMRKR